LIAADAEDANIAPTDNTTTKLNDIKLILNIYDISFASEKPRLLSRGLAPAGGS
jgi:hypothetical protein